MYEISLIAAFIAGMVALFAPCCISYLLPAYLGNIFREKRAVIGMTIIYSLGIATVMLPIVLGARALAGLFLELHTLTYAVGSVLLILIAFLSLLGIKLPMPRLAYSPKAKLDVASTYVLGIVAGITSACCAPVLLGVITLSALSPSLLHSALVSLSYVAGMVAPLYIAALLVNKVDLFARPWWKKPLGSLRLGSHSYPLLPANIVAAVIFSATGISLMALLFAGKLGMDGSGAQTIYQVALDTTEFFRSLNPVELTLIILGIGTGGYIVNRLSHQKASDTTTNTEYHCPMHPEVVSDSPGTCHKCGGMQLVKTKKK